MQWWGCFRYHLFVCFLCCFAIWSGQPPGFLGNRGRKHASCTSKRSSANLLTITYHGLGILNRDQCVCASFHSLGGLKRVVRSQGSCCNFVFVTPPLAGLGFMLRNMQPSNSRPPTPTHPPTHRQQQVLAPPEAASHADLPGYRRRRHHLEGKSLVASSCSCNVFFIALLVVLNPPARPSVPYN